MKKNLKPLLFHSAMAAGVLFASLSLFIAYLYTAKYARLKVPPVLLRLAPVKAILRDKNFENFETQIGYGKNSAAGESGDSFSSVSDHNVQINLSRKQFREVMMYGEPKFMHRPHIKKMYLKVSAQGQEHRLDIEASPELEKILPALGPLAAVSASFDENGFRKTDFDLQGPCDFYTLFNGDSFTEGLFVQDKETFVNQFGHLSNQHLASRNCPINAGVNGYSTLEERFMTEHFYDQFRYPVVFLMHFPNDIHSVFRQVLDGTLPRLDSFWKEQFNELGKIALFCRQKKITLVLAAIPPKEQFQSPETRKNYQDILRAFCEKEGVVFVDLYEAFAKEDYSRYYITWDAHFSPEGHRRTAEILWEKTQFLYQSLKTNRPESLPVKTEF